ncbi:hypothetical protein [Streptomyces sp. NBC_01530]|uniref:hypothetical protein n=1 Tax=Streptomyces sp. NBC_01530 TaxID=2903895 RepID=UPI003868C6CF
MTRFHLTLASTGRTVMSGWWADEATARGKFRDWIGRNVADARVVLVDEETGRVLASWPDEE